MAPPKALSAAAATHWPSWLGGFLWGFIGAAAGVLIAGGRMGWW